MNTDVEVTNARPVDRVDSWNWTKDYFQMEEVDGPVNDDGPESDQGASSDEDYEFHPSGDEDEDKDEEEMEEEEEEEEEISVDSISIDEDEEASDPEILDPQPLIVEQPPSPQPLIFTIPVLTTAIEEEVPVSVEPVTQTQSPPITPEQPSISSSRKRPLPVDEDESPTTSLTVPIHCVNTDSRTQSSAVQTNIDTSSDQIPSGLVEENASRTNRNEDHERAIKRRRAEETPGWSNVMKTMGKYTVAGVVGGIATFVGLAWSAGN
jgi:hypothetical protein